jgi:hypothetical protein
LFWIFWRHSWLIYRVHSIHDTCDVIHGFFCKAIIVWATCINVIWACSDNIYRTCEMTHFTNPYRNRTSIALFIEVYVWLMKIFVSDPQRYYGIIANYLFTFLSSRWLSPVTLVSSYVFFVYNFFLFLLYFAKLYNGTFIFSFLVISEIVHGVIDSGVIDDKRVRVIVFNATFNNISVISWRSVLLVKVIYKKNIRSSYHLVLTYYFLWMTLN